MSAAEVAFLVIAGGVAGMLSTVVGLASLVSYPALLAVGLPPVTANMTNTVALVFTGVGSVAGSQPELAGQRVRVARFGVLAAAGGAVGAGVLLWSPSAAFEALAPWLIGAASLVFLLQPRVASLARTPAHEGNLLLLAALCGVTVYTGYFGAAGGVMMLAVLAALLDEPLVRVNALKNLLMGLANAVAALAFIAVGSVQWAAAVPLAVGFLGGGALGPAVVRRIPATVLRMLVAVAGLSLAVKLGIDAARS